MFINPCNSIFYIANVNIFTMAYAYIDEFLNLNEITSFAHLTQ